MFAVMSVVALALAGGAEAKDTTAPMAQSVATQELKPGERKVKVICKTRAATGTRFTKRNCMELEAYKKQQEEDRRAFEQVQNRPLVNISRGN